MQQEHPAWSAPADALVDPLGIAEDMESYSARHAQAERAAAEEAAAAGAAEGSDEPWATDEGPTVPRQYVEAGPGAPPLDDGDSEVTRTAEVPVVEAAAADPLTDEPTTGEPPLTTYEVSTYQPVWQQPAWDQPAPQQPAVEPPVVQQAVVEQAGWEQPAHAQQPLAQQPAPPVAFEQPAAPPPGGTPAVTATDFLDRRADAADDGPATWGWRGRMTRWSGGLIHPRMGAAEHAHRQGRRMIQRDFDGPRTVVFVNPKGGAAKTTGVLAAGYTFGTVRGGGVIAWDNNETRGTLGIRGQRGSHRNTTRELLEDLERFSDVYQSRIGDLGAFVRSQGDAHFDVLASDERPDVTGMIRATDFSAVHRLLQRFYRVILVDTGNNMRAENWLAAADAADLLVVTSTVREDTGYSGLWMLDALADAGYADLQAKTLTVLSDPSPVVDTDLARDLTSVYEQRTRGVFRVPYDPALVSGSVVPYDLLSEETRAAWLQATAAIAGAL
ncbi:MAG: hypothetical protein U0R80_08290 [Nocardioidaceae bacterium]